MPLSTFTELTTNAVASALHTEAFQRARADWRRAARSPSTGTALTVAVSRESGAGGAAVARQVGQLLGWPVYDRELLERIADEAGLRTELLESLDEKRSHWLLEIAQSLSGVTTMSGSSYAAQVAETVLALAALGNCVLVGRGSTIIVPPKNSLRVRLVASLDDRTERVCKRLGVTKVEAIRHVRFNDEQREGFVKDHFHRNVGDPHDYDLIINTSRFTLEQSAALIVAAIHKLEESRNE